MPPENMVRSPPLYCHQGLCLVYGPTAAGVCYHQRSGVCLSSELPSGDVLMSWGWAELATPLAWASWESWPWGYENRRGDPTSSQLQYSREWPWHIVGSTPGCRSCGLADPEDMSMGEPALPLVSHSVAWLGRDPVPSLCPPHLWQQGELVLPLTSCSTWVSPPKSVSVRELVPQLVCCATARERDRCFLPASRLAT